MFPMILNCATICEKCTLQHAIQFKAGQSLYGYGKQWSNSLVCHCHPSPERPPGGRLPLGCSMHMANHSCNPNCRAIPYEPEDWNNDLVLLLLVTVRDILSGEDITFQYKGSLWQLHTELPFLAPLGFQLIQCGCDQLYPNNLARLDWIEIRD
jgi:hypothetical protein